MFNLLSETAQDESFHSSRRISWQHELDWALRKLQELQNAMEHLDLDLDLDLDEVENESHPSVKSGVGVECELGKVEKMKMKVNETY